MAEDLILRPNATGDYSQGSPSGYDKVDEVTPDEDSTYVQATGSDTGVTAKELYNLPNPEVGGSINSVTLYVRGRIGATSQNNFSHCYGAAKINGTYYWTDLLDPHALTYATQSKVWTLNPTTGIAWTWSDINQLQVGVRLYAWNGGVSGTFYARCTQVYVVVNYNPLYAPTVTTTSPIEDILSTTATGRGNITATGGANATRRGFCYMVGTSGDPTIANSVAYTDGSFGIGVYTKGLTGLSPGITYRVRAYAVNSAGVGYGTTVQFTTLTAAPTVTTQDPTPAYILTTSVRGNGTITATGGEDCSERGFQYGLTQTPTWTKKVTEGGYVAGAFYLTINGLQPNTEYWYRAFAKNTVDPYYGYGAWVKFQTAAAGTTPTGTKISICSDYSGYTYILNESLTDDGNTYKSHFTISTDLADKQGLHSKKRLEDLYSYFEKKDGTCKIYIKRDSETTWQYCGEISMTGEDDIVVPHLPSENQDSSGDVDWLAKHFLIRFEFENDFSFIGLITEAVPIGVR